MSHLSYIVETNGENGVSIDYVRIDYTPDFVSWVGGENSFANTNLFPNPENYDSPEYVRASNGSGFDYFQKTIVIPAKTSTFLVSLIVDGSESGAFYYGSFVTFLDITKNGNMLSLTSTTNLDRVDRTGFISITSNTYSERITIPILQQYTQIGLYLNSFESYGIDGADSGNISSQNFEHVFHWLTPKTSPNEEWLKINVTASGPRMGFIIYDVTKIAYVGQLDNSYGYSNITGKYYETLQTCRNGEFEIVQQEVIYEENSEGVYKKVDYNDDLKITKNENTVNIVNYGRVFLEDDAYYVITLANVDDLRNTCTIIIRYEDEEL